MCVAYVGLCVHMYVCRPIYVICKYMNVCVRVCMYYNKTLPKEQKATITISKFADRNRQFSFFAVQESAGDLKLFSSPITKLGLYNLPLSSVWCEM